MPAYRKSGNRKTSWCADNCRVGKRIKQLGGSLLEGRNETMAEQMAEERNWDVLCEKAEKLREQKLSWAKIANRLGVSESTLYHNVAKRREKKRGLGSALRGRERKRVQNHWSRVQKLLGRKMNILKREIMGCIKWN
ncbi:hypothetical protein bthur0008_6100 [Bacillus thuringiensis serovar berliner ATCC 10792]|nr:hypothetical protein bthur0008_6100 [Bacillus thuringiensis serovar berliner ATCC 10792]